MLKVLKIFPLLILTVVLFATMVACDSGKDRSGISSGDDSALSTDNGNLSDNEDSSFKNELIGKWERSFTDRFGDKKDYTIEINADGTYKYVYSKNDVITVQRAEEYEIKDNEVRLYADEYKTSYYVYKYENGRLVYKNDAENELEYYTKAE